MGAAGLMPLHNFVLEIILPGGMKGNRLAVRNRYGAAETNLPCIP